MPSGRPSAIQSPTSSGSPTLLPRSIRPRRSDDESPACKAPLAVSPVIPGVSTRTVSSTIVSSASSYTRTATSYAPPVPNLRSVLYGERPPILPTSIPLPRFANKNFVPSHVRSSSVATQQYPRPRSHVLPRFASTWMLSVLRRRYLRYLVYHRFSCRPTEYVLIIRFSTWNPLSSSLSHNHIFIHNYRSTLFTWSFQYVCLSVRTMRMTPWMYSRYSGS